MKSSYTDTVLSMRGEVSPLAPSLLVRLWRGLRVPPPDPLLVLMCFEFFPSINYFLCLMFIHPLP